MFSFLFDPPKYDPEIYEIAYESKTMNEAFSLATEYRNKLGYDCIVIGLALSQASTRLQKFNVRN